MKIFTYWDKEKLPVLNEYCIYTWKKYNPEIPIIMLNDTNIHQYIKTFPVNYDKLMIQHKSDYIRTYVLYNYGGIWIDNTIIITGKIEDIFELNIKNKLQLYRSRTTHSCIKARSMSKYRNFYFDNHLMCCLTPNNELIKVWLDNFTWCIQNLNAQYTNAPPLYFKDVYGKIKKGMDFRMRGYTYYLTHMNVLSILLTSSDIYHKYYINLNRFSNLLIWEKEKFHYQDNQPYTKIEQHGRKHINEIIEKNAFDEHPELYKWFEVDYFNKQIL